MELRLRQFVGRFTRIAAFVFIACALLLCAAALMPTQKAYAVTDGWNEWGTCEWQIDDQNCLTIRPIDNGEKGYSGDGRPWDIRKIQRVVFDGKVQLLYNSGSLFKDCTNLKYVDGFENVQLEYSPSGFFANCISLESIDLSNFDMSGHTSYGGMFENCTSLKSVNFGENKFSPNVDLDRMFFGCTSLENVEFSKSSKIEPRNTTSMFENCASLKSFDFSMWDTTNLESMSRMFNGCTSLESIDLSGLKLDRVGALEGLFQDCSSLKTVNMSNLSLYIDSMVSMFDSCEALEEVNFEGTSINMPVNANDMFNSCRSLSSVDLTCFGENHVTGAYSMFSGCEKLESIQLPDNFIGSNCTNINYMFQFCDSLTVIPSNFTFGPNADSLTAYGEIFYYSPTLENLVLKTNYDGNDANVLNYDWAGDNRKLVTSQTSELTGTVAIVGDPCEGVALKATATLDASCNDAQLRYQWFDASNDQQISEVTDSATFTIPEGSLGKSFYCVVTDASGKYTSSLKSNTVIANHDYGDWTVTKQPTCTEDGEQKHSCQTCGWEETETIPTTSHAPSSEWTNDATDHWHVCQNCQAEVDKAAHTFGQWITVTEPGEFTPGEKVRTCEVCDYEERAEIPGTGHVSDEQWHFDGTNHWNLCTDCGSQINVEAHDFGEWTVDIPAGCTTEGTEIRTCATCGYEQTQTIPATGHTYGEWTVTTEPTCTEKGVESRTCENCDNTETRAVDELGHNFSADWSSDANGHRHECTRCDAVADEAAHTFGDWQVKQAAGCTDGIEARYCTVCNYEETRTIPGAGHQPASEWSSDASGHWHACANCDDRLDLAEHAFGDWTVTADPTEEAAGSKERTCEVCGYKDVVEIPALTPGDPNDGIGESGDQGSSDQQDGEESSGEETEATPQTSDPLGVVASLMAGAVLISAATAIVARRKMLRR